MKPFNDWQMYSQLFVSGLVPVLFSVIIIGSAFFGGLYELKNDAISAQNIIHDMRTDSYLFTSELREYLINFSGGKDNKELLKEIDQIRQRLNHTITNYSKTAEEGEAANSQTLSDAIKIVKKLDAILLMVNHSDIDIHRLNKKIEAMETDIHNIFGNISSLAKKEIEIEMVLLSWLVIGASILSLLGAVIFVRNIAKKIVQQILTLTDISANFGDGKLFARADINSLNEMGQLSKSFNKMADDLQKTLTSLELEIIRCKSSEQALKKSHTELEYRVKKRSDELKKRISIWPMRAA